MWFVILYRGLEGSMTSEGRIERGLDRPPSAGEGGRRGNKEENSIATLIDAELLGESNVSLSESFRGYYYI